MDANLILNKIREKRLNDEQVLMLYGKLYDAGAITIGDAIMIKTVLGLTDFEAVDLFLS